MIFAATFVASGDGLTLADLAYSYFVIFGRDERDLPPREPSARSHESGSADSNLIRVRSISELATSIYQEEKWVGSVEQHSSLLRRLAVGRTFSQVELIRRIRDLFEKMDTDGDGEHGISQATKLITALGRSVATLSSQMDEFKRQSSASFSLPEFLAHFGFIFEGLTDDSPTVAGAFAKLRLHCATADVRLVAETVIKYLDNALSHPKDSNFWQISTSNETYRGKVGQHPGGRALMFAVGFTLEKGADSSVEFLAVQGCKNAAGRPVSQLDSDTLDRLKSRRDDVEQELAALEGVPSVSAALRQIRARHSMTDVKAAADTALLYVINILRHPRDNRVYRVKTANTTFNGRIGRLNGGSSLMEAIGFTLVDDGEVWRFGLRKTVDQPGQEHKDFKFPGLDHPTEAFLWRRTADLEGAIQLMETSKEFMGIDHMATPQDDLKDAAVLSKKTSKQLLASSKGRGEKARPSSPPKASMKASRGGRGVKGTIKGAKSDAGELSSMKLFFKGKTLAQRAQLEMVRMAFNRLDLNHDGMISAEDLRTAFRQMGVDAGDRRVRQWIKERDIDQDERVSFEEFVVSFGALFQPDTAGWQKAEDQSSLILPEDSHGASPLAAAFGTLRLYTSIPECIVAVEYIQDLIEHILGSPSSTAYWRIRTTDKLFDSSVGRLFGGIALMESIGFQLEENATVLALADPKGLRWSTVPDYMIRSLKRTKEELDGHLKGLFCPDVSDVAAVSSAIVLIQDKKDSLADWVGALETVTFVISNILDAPHDQRYRFISLANPKFQKTVGKISGGVQLLVALGFRETETGGLDFPVDQNLTYLAARKVEIDTGLAWLKRVYQQQQVEEASKAPGKDVIRRGMASSPTRNPAAKHIASSPAKAKAMGRSSHTGAEPAKTQVDAQKENVRASENIGLGSMVEMSDEMATAKKALMQAIRQRKTAEDALVKKETTIMKLEQEVKELTSKLSHTLPLKDMKTIARMTAQDQKKAQDLATKLGLEFASVPPAVAAAAAATTGGANNLGRGFLSKTGPAASQKAYEKAKSSLKVVTLLSADVRAGSNQIDVEAVTGLKVGQKIRISSQGNTEERFIVAFGSVILHEPLTYDHYLGEEIFVLKVTPKERKAFEKGLLKKFVINGILIPLVYGSATTAERLISAREMQEAYERRMVLKPVWLLQRTFAAFAGVVKKPSDARGTMTVVPSKGRLVASAPSNEEGQIKSLLIYDEGFPLAEVRRFFNKIDGSGDQAISKHELRNAILRDPALGATLLANDPNYSRANQDRAASLFGALDADNSDSVGWEEFLTLFLPCHELKPVGPSGAPAVIDSNDDR